MSFIEKEMNYFMFMQLRDLAYSFTNKAMDIQYNQVSFLDIYEPKVTITSFWENRQSIGHLGEKSDIYLRALGNYHLSDRQALQTFLELNQSSTLPSFTKQIVAFLEDIRLEAAILQYRPGTKKAFDYRRKMYMDFFKDQLKVNRSRAFHGDTLFCFLALVLLQGMDYYEDGTLSLSPSVLTKVKEKLFTVFECKETNDVVSLAWEIFLLVEHELSMDMINPYFTLPKIKEVKESDLDEDEFLDEVFPTWNRERKKETKETFLQFDVDGQHQDMKFDNTGRESESTDQVMAMVQGQAQQSDQNDHSEASAEQVDSDDDFSKGKANRFAVAKIQEPTTPSEQEQAEYEFVKNQISFEQKKLKKLLTDLLERKREQNFRRLHYGKLDRKLVRFFTSDNPKMFIKKEEDQQFDCVFSLLMDCSSSMMDKMDKTKEAVVLFHETLKEMNIRHAVTGFWEDGIESDEKYQPNYFLPVISFVDSLKKQSGEKIMQLQPEEDNRDGFAIRYISEALSKQGEQHKFLIVLTDGKPAAFDYYQNGVMDTKEAIQETKNKGIHTIGVQIGSQSQEQEKMMEAMYNNKYMMVENMDSFVSQFSFLLKTLLVSSN
ncbi:nitric oxide reductase activation protein [Salirhabdus euzebyi]|uniref:Nitric oxide reductase activation protein n=1 Tax=Salirhabdus euzebyi TaxID=394506 RepID=A0A841PU40_9BACI|nr:hypothetical protein [Salirhabdus euzebyi]MBB6452320.1 nitric oxide reductase activation protein [Salirhabdus euzebyi]